MSLFILMSFQFLLKEISFIVGNAWNQSILIYLKQ